MTWFKHFGVVTVAVWLFLFLYDPNYSKQRSPIESVEWVQSIAHAGGKGLAPENTIVAFDLSVISGADVLEIDIHGTSDNKLVVLHDTTTTRTTDQSLVVKDSTLEQLQNLDAGYHFELNGEFVYRGQEISLPRLDEVLQRYPNYEFIIEIKQRAPSIAQTFCQTIKSFDMEAQVVVGSFHHEALQQFRQYCPTVRTSASKREVTEFFVLNLLGLSHWYGRDVTAFQVPESFSLFQVVTQRFIRNAHRLGIEVHVWTVNDEAKMRELIEMGVDGIITDYPARLRDLRRSK